MILMSTYRFGDTYRRLSKSTYFENLDELRVVWFMLHIDYL